MTADDASLLELIRSDLDKGFRELVDIYKQRLYWQIRKMVLVHADADDVLQNVFIKVYRNLDNFKGESKLHTWLYRIAYNESLNFLQSKSRRQTIDNEEFTDYLIENLQGDPYYSGDDAAVKLQKALLKLPDRQREVFNLRYYDDLKFREIAEVLDLTEGAVKASYHHAAEKLKTWIIEI
jgi:RNA polymerase sigma-70 factor (ECF subfamily)